MKTPCQRLLSMLVIVLVLSLIPSVMAADNDEKYHRSGKPRKQLHPRIPTTTPPQSDPLLKKAEGSSAGAPDSQPHNEYGIATNPPSQHICRRPAV